MKILPLLFLSAALLPAIERKEDPSTLLTVKRVYVDRFGGGETASQIRDMVIASLQTSGLFVLTENQERADVTLKGSGEDLVFTCEARRLIARRGVDADLGERRQRLSRVDARSRDRGRVGGRRCLGVSELVGTFIGGSVRLGAAQGEKT